VYVKRLIIFKVSTLYREAMKRRLLIKGERVQDIGYRMFLLNLASEHNMTGFQARNIGGNAVEAVYEGSEEDVREFEDEVRRLMPEEARVDEILFEDYEGDVKDIEKFRSYFITLQLGKMIEIGLAMIQKQDIMAQKQDIMIQKLDAVAQKQEETLKELRALRKDLRSAERC